MARANITDDAGRARQGRVLAPGLERSGRRFGRSAWPFIGIALVFIIPGIVLIVTGTIGFGAAAVLIGSIPGTVGVGLLISGIVSRWSARHRSFA
jgi:hypothetical protein